MKNSSKGLKIIQVTTVPQTLGFLRGPIDYLIRAGAEVHVLTSPGNIRNVVSPDNVQAHFVTMTRTMNPVQDMVSLFRLWISFLRIQPQILHSHTPKAGLLGVLAGRMAGVPVVFLSVFGLPQMTASGIRKLILDVLTKISCHLANAVWCDSQSMKDYLILNGLCRKNKAFVVAHGSVSGVDAINVFNPELFNEGARRGIRAGLGIPEGSVVLGFAGRLARDKGLHELAEAWRILSCQRNDLHLILIGPWEAKDPLSRNDVFLFKSDPKVHVLGFIREVAPLLSTMDIYVMPSYREGFGLTNIEASAMQLPVVSTRIPGCIDSVKEGETGLLVSPRNVTQLVGAIKRYLDDPALRRRHGLRGREKCWMNSGRRRSGEGFMISTLRR